MEHNELLQEMQNLEKLPITERVKLAQKRRKQQLTNYAKWAKTDNSSSRPKTKNTRGITFSPDVQLMDIAARASFDEMRNLLKTGVDPNMKNHDGLTALHQCCIDGSLEMVSLLLKYGAEVNITDQDLWTPLHAAATCGHFKIVTTLVKAGANLTAINGDGDMPHDISEDEVTVQYLENEMTKRGITQDVIQKTRQEPYNVMLKDINKILTTGGDFNQPLDRGSTFLHVAIANGFNDIVKLLKENKASLTVRDEDGWEPIHAAAYWCNEVALDMLTEDKNVYLRTHTDNGETPYDLCDDPELKIKILHKISEMQNVNGLDDLANSEGSTSLSEEVESTTQEEEENYCHEFDDSDSETLTVALHNRKRLSVNNNKEDLHDYPMLDADDTPSTPLLNIQAIELSSDRRNSIKEAKHKAPLKRVSSERLSNKEKYKITNDIERRQKESLHSSDETIDKLNSTDIKNIPHFNSSPNALERDVKVDENDKNKSFLNMNVEYNGIHFFSANATEQQEAHNLHEDLKPEQIHRISRKKMAAPPPPPPTGSLLDLKRQRREGRQLQLQRIQEGREATESSSRFYDSARIYEPPPSPTLIRYKYTMVSDEDDEQGFIKERKCTIM
ncbi:uncharacterized protein [Panulirus ornatus]|uniref:uncharacterized protein n=1 Tax=Panulirus ornatus TaxID=150431 RepID=UPI003A87E814